ncbi:MAG: peroxiredoxin-like family protein [Marinifilaceae bacterium]
MKKSLIKTGICLATFGIMLLANKAEAITFNKTNINKPTIANDTIVGKHVLETQNKKVRDHFATAVPKEAQTIMANGINEVAHSSLIKHTIKVGDKAIDFTLTNAVGKKVNLYDMLKKGPVVLTWYRGGWCPFCNLQLQYLQNSLDSYKELGANIIAISPEKPDSSLSTIEKHKLEFEVLTDSNNKTGKKYGLVYKLSKQLNELYKKSFAIDLAKINDNAPNELPVPATFVIDQKGIIKYVFIDADYTRRAEPFDILEVLEEIKN